MNILKRIRVWVCNTSSLNFSEDYCIKPISIPGRRVMKVLNFVYFSDGQFALFTALFEDWSLGLVYQAMNSGTLIVHIFKSATENTSDPN